MGRLRESSNDTLSARPRSHVYRQIAPITWGVGYDARRFCVNLLSKVTLFYRQIMTPSCGTEGQLGRSRDRTSPQDEPSPVLSMQIIPGCLSIAAR